MGHQHDDSLAALRAYARDLDATATRGERAAVGGLDQDGAPARKSGSGAPHQLAIAALAAGAVLIGSIGIVAARTNGVSPQPSVFVTSQVDGSRSTTLAGSVEPLTTQQAIRAFQALGMFRAATAVEAAVGAGTDQEPTFVVALNHVRRVVASYTASGVEPDESTSPLAEAVEALEAATMPPGLDPTFTPPGLGGTPPGQDENFTPPGQDENFTPPGQSEEQPNPGNNTQGNGRGNAP